MHMSKNFARFKDIYSGKAQLLKLLHLVIQV